MRNELNLRTGKESDFESVWIYSSNQEVTKFLTWDCYTSKEKCKLFFEEQVLKHKTLPNVFLMIELNDKVIGTAHIIQRSAFCNQIGFGILPEYWNKGYGTKIIKLIEKYIVDNFESENCEIKADMHKNNVYMRKILKNAGYEFIGNIENNRESYTKKVETKYKESNFIAWLKNNKLIDCVVKIGSLNNNKYSDVDLLILAYEESSINVLVEDMKKIENVKLIEVASPTHYFFSDSNNTVYDIYIVSTACINAFNNTKKVVFDRSGFVTKLLKLNSFFDLQQSVCIFNTDIAKILDKIKSEKYVQATRILSGIRDKSLIPIGNYINVLEAKNIIDFKWNDKNHIFYKAYMSTFVPPEREGLLNTVKMLIQAEELIIKQYKLDYLEDLFKELSEYAKLF